MTRSQVKVSANWDRWSRGFGSIERGLDGPARRVWQQATDVMFERSQQFAHVLTGENKSSGHFEVTREGDDLVGRIMYDSDHAIYEEMRGGEHAFLTRAWEATESLFRRSMPQVWAEVVRSWR